MQQKKRQISISKILFLLLVLGAVFFVGFSMGKGNSSVFSSQVSAGNGIPDDHDLEVFYQTWKTIEDKYPFDETPSVKERIWSATEGLARSYNDPYTVFFAPEEAKLFNEDIAGEFSGVGMEVGMRNNLITIIAPLKDSPAENAGIRAGDILLEIDDVSTIDMSLDEAVQKIRGKKGTEVALLIGREEEFEPITITIKRDIIKVPTIETELRDDGVFIISLFSFSQNSPELFKDALKKFNQVGKGKLIVDLRNNPGGFLGAAIDISSWFIPEGKVVVRESFGDDEEEIVYRSKGYDIFGKDLKLIILVNGGSASASEIVAGAVSEQGVAELVGAKTFGKGSVQELVQLPSGASVKVTIAKWLTPKGISISDEGIVPDYEVEITREDFEEERDPQMEKAIELLNKK